MEAATTGISAQQFVYGTTVALTLIGLIWYALRCRKTREKFDGIVVIELALNCAGLVIGVVMVSSIFFPQLKKVISDDWLYTFIIGLLMIVFFVTNICKRLGMIK